MAITFNKAQKALGHLINPQQGPKPPLLNVKGWDKSKIIYQLKNDIERAFKTEIDRFRDLIKERNQLQQTLQKEKEDATEDRKEDIEAQLQEINDELTELFEVEKEIELTGNKLTEEQFGDVIDTEIFIDLDFAIEMNRTPPKNEEQ